MKKQRFLPRLSILRLLLLVGTLTLLSACGEEEKAPEVADERPVMRILFVGNDFTFMNNMPYMVVALAQSDPSAHFQVEIEMHVAQDASLSQMWNSPFTRDVLILSKWDYIIIQPHHMWASSEGSVYSTKKALSAWSSQIKAVGAQPVLFTTWPLEATHPSYADPKYFNLKSYKNMHRLTRGYSKALSKEFDYITLPIGDYWMQAMSTKPRIKLYNPDRFTPTLDASYLTALVIYKKLVDGTLDDIVYIPEGMTPEVKAELISIASKKIKN